MLVAFPLGDPAEISRQLKDVLDQRTPADLIHGDLDRTQERQRRVSRSPPHSEPIYFNAVVSIRAATSRFMTSTKQRVKT